MWWSLQDNIIPHYSYFTDCDYYNSSCHCRLHACCFFRVLHVQIEEVKNLFWYISKQVYGVNRIEGSNVLYFNANIQFMLFHCVNFSFYYFIALLCYQPKRHWLIWGSTFCTINEWLMFYVENLRNTKSNQKNARELRSYLKYQWWV